MDRLETAPEEKTYNKQEHKAGGKEMKRDAGVNIHTIYLGWTEMTQRASDLFMKLARERQRNIKILQRLLFNASLWLS